VQLVDGVHHITFLTEDMDRLLDFYVRVFDAEVTLDMTEEGLRHAFLKVGPTTVLHPFQMLEGPGPPPPSPMFSRGRLDHFALLAPPSRPSGTCGAGSRRKGPPTATSATCGACGSWATSTPMARHMR
jgi:catechol 2,3-dioxygenase-like lactoylglutathione lyase family enzyme